MKPVTPFDNNVNVNPEAKNFAASQLDYASFLPSISSIYTKIVSMPEYSLRLNSMPAGLTNGLKDLDFLNPHSHLFYYPVALYSAGHAVLDPKESWTQESMVQQRDRKNTIIVGDSGGYQVTTGVLKWPWLKKENQSDSDWYDSKDKVRMKLLRWLESVSDYAMVLDFPTSSLFKFGNDPVTGENLHPGLKTFRDCLNGSLENHEFFIKNRVEGATKFLNVLQGRNIEEGDIWYNEVKDLPFEAWAFADVNASNMFLNLRRLIIMRDENKLVGKEWLHYLGNGKIKASCVYTTIQRALRKYVDEGLTVSYDASSPFVMTAMGQCNFGYELSHDNVCLKAGPFVDDKSLKNSKQFFNDWIAANVTKGVTPYRSKIGDRITVGDICVKGYEDLEFKRLQFSKKELESDVYKNSMEAAYNDTFKWTNAYKAWMIHSKENGGLFDMGDTFRDDEKYQGKWPSSLDGFSYLLAMNHNVELHLNAIQAANYWQDQPLHIANQYVTPDILEFAELCPEVFRSEKPMELLAKHEKMLQNVTGMNAINLIHMDIEDI